MKMTVESLADEITALYDDSSRSSAPHAEQIFEHFISLLDSGEIRSAEHVDGQWKVNHWIKKGILLGFRLGRFERTCTESPFPYFDKHTYPVKTFTENNMVRIVPGGSSVRKGAYVAPGVIMMPPSYINVGAYVGRGTMVDSHALIGSCAQVGEKVHVSAAAQLGGVLEPIGALPVIIEDEVLIGGNCGIYEGTVVKKRAVLASGVLITASTPVYDCVNETVIRKDENGSVVIPENAVVVAGTRALAGSFASAQHLGVYTPLIVKYRDNKTDARTALEESLR